MLTHQILTTLGVGKPPQELLCCVCQPILMQSPSFSEYVLQDEETARNAYYTRMFRSEFWLALPEIEMGIIVKRVKPQDGQSPCFLYRVAFEAEYSLQKLNRTSFKWYVRHATLPDFVDPTPLYRDMRL